MFPCPNMYRWIGRWALATSLQTKTATSKSERTVYTRSDLAHAHNLRHIVSKASDLNSRTRDFSKGEALRWLTRAKTIM